MEATGARRGVNEKHVWTAADALLLEGRRPTIESVRLKIGRGSPNTITPYLDTWFKGLGRRLQDPHAFASASAVPEPVATAAVHFWEAALALARGQLEEGTASEREAFRIERDELGASQVRLAQDAATLEARREALDEAVRLAKTQLDEATRQTQLAQERCQALETRANNLEAELRSAREMLDIERRSTSAEANRIAQERSDERSRHDAAERRWLGEVDRARGEAAKIVKQLADQETRSRAGEEAAHRRIEFLQDELTATRRELLARNFPDEPSGAPKSDKSRPRTATSSRKRVSCGAGRNRPQG